MPSWIDRSGATHWYNMAAAPSGTPAGTKQGATWITTAGTAYQYNQISAVWEITGRGILKAELTIGHADLTAAATNESIDFAIALPAGAYFFGAYIDIDTLFSGGSVSDLDIDVGISGGDTNYLLEDVPAFTGDPTGVVLGTAGAAFASDDSNIAKSYQASSVTIAVDVKATGDNVVNLAAGDVNVVVLYSIAAQTS
jgi:hypothetical protein